MSKEQGTGRRARAGARGDGGRSAGGRKRAGRRGHAAEGGRPAREPSEHRKAHGIEPGLQARAGARLRRIEGQVRGLQRMVDEGRYCADILTQISSVQEALRSVGKLLMRNHLQHCVTDALRSGDRLDAERAYQEVLDLMYTHAR